MEYNSKKEELIIPEYGRNIQAMIRYARELPNRAERQAVIDQPLRPAIRHCVQRMMVDALLR